MVDSSVVLDILVVMSFFATPLAVVVIGLWLTRGD